MSAKYDAFKAELIALCEKHGCQLASGDYERIQVWDLKEGESPIDQDYIEDKTE